jgi:hypothetical protein
VKKAGEAKPRFRVRRDDAGATDGTRVASTGDGGEGGREETAPVLRGQSARGVGT